MLFLLSCSKEQPEPAKDSLVYFSLDTKSLGAGERTFRAALINISGMFRAQGTYCTQTINHESTLGPGVIWLSPCRVDNNGGPLKSDGSEAAGLSEADKDSKYGLRLYVSQGTTAFVYLVVSSPAKAYSGTAYTKYYPWNPSIEYSISDPVGVNFAGSWLEGEYVYTSLSKENLNLKNRRASLKVHVQCGALSDAYIQSISLLNAVNSARWNLLTGIDTSPSLYSTTTTVLYDCGTGAPEHLVKANSDVLLTSSAYLPPVDFSDDAYADMRPRIQVLMGNDKDHPFKAIVDITEKMDPMKEYTFNLLVSKSEVVVSLSTADWDDGGTISSVSDESPAYIGTVSVDGWTDNGSVTADNWNTSFE